MSLSRLADDIHVFDSLLTRSETVMFVHDDFEANPYTASDITAADISPKEDASKSDTDDKQAALQRDVNIYTDRMRTFVHNARICLRSKPQTFEYTTKKGRVKHRKINVIPVSCFTKKNTKLHHESG